MNSSVLRARLWLPSVLVAAPLTGLSLVSDERRSIYRRALTNDANPISAAVDALRGIDGYFGAGNFRPLGRTWEMLVHGFVFEAAEATSVAPHIVLGVVRLLMVALLAAASTAVVAALARSAGVDARTSFVGMYPLALAASLVANGTTGALAQFPHMLVGTVALMLGITLAISRDRDLQRRLPRRRECAAMALTGGAAAMFYDLAYLTPLIAAVFLVARCVASKTSLRQALRTAAAKRWAAHVVGFAAVFVPSRVLIALECADGDCYVGSDLSLSLDAVGTAAPRLLTGFPPVGWARNAGRADLRLSDLAANAFTALSVIVLAALAVLAVASCVRATSTEAPSTDRLTTESSAAGHPMRLAASLALLGATTAILAASVAGLTTWAQQRQPAIGEAWRETLLTQVAWSLLAAALLAMLGASMRAKNLARFVRATAAGSVLAAAMVLTLLANWRFAEASRTNSTASIVSQISLASVLVDESPTGNALRCDLIEAYRDATPDAPSWKSAQAIVEDLNSLMLQRHGFPYCDPNRSGLGKGSGVSETFP